MLLVLKLEGIIMRHYGFSIIPYAWIGGYVFTLLIAFARFLHTSYIKLICSYLSALPLCLIAGEIYAYHHNATSPSMTKPNSILGYANTPNLSTSTSLIVDSTPIYTINYTNDAFGNRLTPNNPTSSRCINLYGGSFTYGNGVDDTQTLAAYLAQDLPHMHINNFGIGAAGLAQMLARLEFNMDASTLQSCKENIFIYIAIAHHIYRALGAFLGPKYALNATHTPIYQGIYTEKERERFIIEQKEVFTQTLAYMAKKLANQLEKSHLKQLFNARDKAINGESSQELLKLPVFALGFASNPNINIPLHDTQLYFALLQQVKHILHTRFHAKLIVLYWDYDFHAQFLNQYDMLITKNLAKAHIPYYRISEILGEEYKKDLERAKKGAIEPFTYRISRFDTHPNAKANQAIAAFLAHEITRHNIKFHPMPAPSAKY